MSQEPRKASLWKRGILALVVLLAVAQLVRPDRTIPPVAAEKTVERLAKVPPAVASTLRRSCFDCHSNQPRWPWYSHITPVSFFVVDHVQHGREHLNFSDWTAVASGENKDALEDICEEVKKGAMPLPSYLWLHSDARLAAGDIAAICEWTAAEEQRREDAAPEAAAP